MNELKEDTARKKKCWSEQWKHPEAGECEFRGLEKATSLSQTSIANELHAHGYNS